MIAAQNATLIAYVLCVFFAAYFGTAGMRRLAWQYGWVVPPRADRWHTQPTALHGGVGFYPAFLCGAIWLLFSEYRGLTGQELILKDLPSAFYLASAMLVGSLVMAIVGLWDDIKSFRPATKLLFQVVATSIFVYSGGVFPLTDSQLCNLLLTYFWFVGIINAVNMLDNMDGLASGVVILAGCTLVLLTLLHYGLPLSQAPVPAVPLGFVFVATLLGFWFHNRPPATIFMGDSGSLSIGYVLAALAVPSPLNGYLGIHTDVRLLGPVLALLIPTTVLAIPIFDTTLVTLTRIWRAQKASQGGRDHSSHRLVGIGLSEKRAVWVLYALAMFGGIVAVLLQQFPQQSLPLAGLFALGLVLTGVYLGHTKVYPPAAGQRPPMWTPLVSKLLYKRHAAEVLMDTVLIVICFYGAYLLRFEGNLAPTVTQAIMQALPLVVASCLLAFFGAGIYRGTWRFLSIPDLPSHGMGVAGGTVLSLATVTLVTRFANGHSRSAYIIFGLLLFLVVIGSRLSFRLFEALSRQGQSDLLLADHTPVLIYGAGKAGKLLHEEVASNPQMQPYTVVGFIDDDPNRSGKRLCGVPVKHGAEWLLHPWNQPPEVWISSHQIRDGQARQLIDQWHTTTTVRRLHLQIKPIFDAQLAVADDKRDAAGEPTSAFSDPD